MFYIGGWGVPEKSKQEKILNMPKANLVTRFTSSTAATPVWNAMLQGPRKVGRMISCAFSPWAFMKAPSSKTPEQLFRVEGAS